jgi:hypothetical protein
VEQPYLEYTRDGRPQVVALSADQLTIGRAPANDLPLASEDTVSGRHAIIERQEGGWMIRDLGSSNGTFVNGQRLTGSALLRPGDEVGLGKVRLSFRLPPVPGGPLPAGPADYLAATAEWAVEDQPPAQPPGGPPGQPAPPGSPEPTPPPGPTPTPPRLAAPAPYVATGVAAGSMSSGGTAIVRGVAKEIKTRRHQNDYTVLSFRVDRYDQAGNRIQPVGVELIGYRSGQLSEGEQVEVVGHWKRGTLRAHRVVNLTTNAEIVGPLAVAKVARTAFVVIFCCFFFTILGAIILAAFSG